MAPEGHRPRPRRLDRARRIWTGGGIVFGPRRATTPSRSTARSGAPRCAARSRVHADRGSIAVVRPERRSTTPRPRRPPRCSPTGRQRRLGPGRADRRAGARGAAFRNLERVSRPARATDVGVADLIGAAAVLASPGGARHAPTAPRVTCEGGSSLMDASQVIIRPVVSEKSYVLAAADKYTFRVHPDAHKTQIRQAVEAALRRQGRRGPHDVRQVQAQAPRAHLRAHARVEEGHRAGARRRLDPDLPGPAGPRGASRCRSASPSPPAPVGASSTYPDFAEITKTEAREDARRGAEEVRRPQLATAARPPAIVAAGPSALYRKIDFKRAQGRDPRPRSPRSSTTPTGPPTSRCCTTSTASRPTSWPRRACRSAMTVMSGPTRRDRGRQLPAAGEHADRHRRPQRRAAARPRRPDGPLRRHVDPAHGEGRRHGHPAPALGRDAPGARRVPRDRRRRSATPITRTSRSARPAASATWACARRRAARP